MLRLLRGAGRPIAAEPDEAKPARKRDDAGAHAAPPAREAPRRCAGIGLERPLPGPRTPSTGQRGAPVAAAARSHP